MEAILFCGIQGSGKTAFYKEYFFKTHLRLSMDMLHTRNKEWQFLQTCITISQRFVIDNTNPIIVERWRYIEPAKSARFQLVCYFFNTDVAAAIERNRWRSGKECIPIAGIKGTYNKLQVPTYKEGFDLLYYVTLLDSGFVIALQESPQKQHVHTKNTLKQ